MLDKYFVLSVISLAIVVIEGCGTSHKEEFQEAVFPDQRMLEGKCKSMEVVIKSGTIFECGDYVLVYDLYDGADFHYAVFNKYLDYLYSFCRKGNGPGECLFPTMVKGVPADICMIRDHGNDRFNRYRLTDSCAYFLGSRLPENSGFDFPFEISMISPDEMLLKNSSANKIRREIWRMDSLKSIYSLPSSFNYEKKMGKYYHPEYDDFWMVADSGKFMCAYFFLNCIEFGSIDSGELHVNRFWGSRGSPDLYTYESDPPSNKYKYSIQFNTVYFESAAIGLGKFWVGYAGIPWGDISTTHSKVIECFSLLGVPEAKYHLSIPLESFIVLSDPDRIVGINPELNEDAFIIYDL